MRRFFSRISKDNKSPAINWARVILAFCITNLLVFSLPAAADSSTEKINRVKAAFVYNIAKFVTWPESVLLLRPQTLQVCFYQRNFLEGGFGSVIGRKIDGRVLASKVIADLSQSSTCDMLLLSEATLGHYLQEPLTEHVGLLTIADMSSSSQREKLYQGVALNLVRRGSSMGFEVSLGQAEKCKLQVSSQLLKLAHILDEEDNQ